VIQNRPVILALDSLKQENLEFEANLDYIASPCPKKKKKIHLVKESLNRNHRKSREKGQRNFM
jgi:hypothetical protein